MTTQNIAADRILVVCGLTDQEILRQAGGEKIDDPPSFYFDVKNVQYTPHIKSYEGFESAQGLIPIEKACDNFAELTFEVLVHQNISDAKGSFVVDNKTKEVRLRVADQSTETTEDINGNLQLTRWVDPEDYTDEYIELRSNFFKDLDGRPLTIVSPLFPPIPVGFIESVEYNIAEGTEEANYQVVIKEYVNTGI